MTFKPGKSGNPDGRMSAEKRLVRGALARYAITENPNAWQQLARKVWSDAIESTEFERNRWATEFIADRIEGKPKQVVTGGDDDDAPIQVAGALSPAAEALLAAAMAGLNKKPDEKA